MSDNSLGVKDEFFESMLSDFLDESGELLEQLNQNLLQLDEWANDLKEGESARCDEDLLNEMFRAAHSFKGLSAMLGLDDINQLTHKVENVFDAARSAELSITADVVELIFQSVDRLVGMVERLKDPSAEEVDCESVLADIQTLLHDSGAERKKATQQEAEDSFAAAFEEAQAAAQTTSDVPSNPSLNDSLSESNEDYFAGIEDDAEISPKYLSIFIDEAETTLDELSEKLLASVDEDHTESLLVVCHRIKGSAASVGLNRIARLAHFMEDLLQVLNQSGNKLTPEMTDAMLRCSDALRANVDDLRQGEGQLADFNSVCQELLAAQGTTPATVGEQENSPDNVAEEPQEFATDLSDEYLAEIASAAPEGMTTCAIQVTFREGLPLVALKARLAFEKSAQLGKLFYCRPSEEEIDDLDELSCLTVGVATEESPDAIRDRIRIEGVERVEVKSLPVAAHEVASGEKPGDQQLGSTEGTTADVTPVESESTNLPAKENDEPANSEKDTTSQQKERAAVSTRASSKPAETVRVDIDRLDQLMNLAGQLVINKARFSQIGDRLKHLTASKQGSYSLANVFGTLERLESTLEGCSEKSSQTDLETISSHARRIQGDLQAVQREVDQFKQMRISVNELLESVHQLDRVSDGIQKCVMDTRMVPVGPLFGRFKRVIRDITRGNGKEIQLVIRGEKTELDKRMIDELGDPLIHMIRNCADHGIESPEDREAVGKPRQGTVTLDAFHRGNSIVIQVKDDGKGLDVSKIRDKAIEKGIVTEADAERLTQHQMFQLIWEPGLSTAEKVTQVSGRGMGMDIVRSKIEELSGTVELDSEVGVGTTILIKLPLTLAILPSLLADIDGDVFAVPVESVVEIVRVQKKDLASVHGLTTACVRGRIISVVSLANLFSWNQQAMSTVANGDEDVTLVIAGSEGRELGLVVHDLLGEEDIVIKSMAENYRNVDGIAGASILGDGRVALILDVGSLLEFAANHTHGASVA